MTHQKTTSSEKGESLATKTIVALASAQGAAAISLLRLSGPSSFSHTSACIKEKTFRLEALKLRHAYYVRLYDPLSGDLLDDVVCTFYKGPESYTGEDLVEISCHGSPYIVQRLLKVFYDLGCAPAQPGEYTRRAYLNGRMDLTRAEGIRELVEAQSSGQWFAARQLAEGRLAGEIDALRAKLVEASAYLEAQIDFPDEGDTAHLHLQHVLERARLVKERCIKLLGSYQSGHMTAFGPKVVICGIPNAGKSTLLNALLGKERAIVTAIAGTTRDYIEEGCLVSGRYIRLIDTAGIRDSAETVEQIGIHQARRLASEADLVLFLAASDQDPKDWQKLLDDVSKPGKKIITILTKADLAKPAWANDFLQVSAICTEGVEALKKAITGFVDQHADQIKDIPFITSARHASALEAALTALTRFFEEAERASHVECLAFELQEVSRALQSIVGDVHHEDILDKVFSEFCVGK